MDHQEEDLVIGVEAQEITGITIEDTMIEIIVAAAGVGTGTTQEIAITVIDLIVVVVVTEVGIVIEIGGDDTEMMIVNVIALVIAIGIVMAPVTVIETGMRTVKKKCKFTYCAKTDTIVFRICTKTRLYSMVFRNRLLFEFSLLFLK